MAIKLSDAQLVLLSAASQRGDRCLVAPQHLKGAAAKKVADKLIGAGLAREIRAKGEAPVWRRDEDEGVGYALKLTAAGMKAIAVEDDVAEEADVGRESDSSTVHLPVKPPSRARCAPASTSNPNGAINGVLPSSTNDSNFRAPREGSKLATVIGLLRREGGAALNELVAATGWLPHTVRAAMTGLRQRGYGVSREKPADGKGSIYRLAEVPQEVPHTTGIAPDIVPAEVVSGEPEAAATIAPSEGAATQAQPQAGRPRLARRAGRREEPQSGRPSRRRAA